MGKTTTQNAGHDVQQPAISHRVAHYLIAIKELHEEFGYARLTDIAKRLAISPGSCSLTLKTLKQRGLIKEDSNRFLLLSEEGIRFATLIQHSSEQLTLFFEKYLGVSPDQAKQDACQIEHLLSVETSFKLCRFVHLLEQSEEKVMNIIKKEKQHTLKCKKDKERCRLCQAYEIDMDP